jgi:hydrogenase nickel incorporation protein HypA/HybF
MHELTITEAIVSGIHQQLGPARVRKVTLEIGVLSAVLPDAVRFCFDVCARGTPCEGAELQIVETKGRARCRACNSEFEPRDVALACPCGAFGGEVLSGQQILVRTVEVD